MNLKDFKSLIDKGDERLEKEMDIVKILKRLRKFKFILGYLNKNPNLINKIYHSKEYLIDLDEGKNID